MKTVAFALLALVSTSAIAAAAPPDGDTYAPKTAPEATTDPEVGLYRLPGAIASGADDSGVATSIRCTNYSFATEKVHVTVMDSSGNVVRDSTFPLAARSSNTYSTNATRSMLEAILAVPAFRNGSMVLAATTKSLHCTAMIHDASAFIPTGIAAHLIRFNAVPGSQE